MSGAPDTRVVAVGPVPPPVQGAAATTEALTAQLAGGGDLRFFNNAIGARGPAPWRALVKIGRTARAAVGTLIHARGRNRAFYIALDGGLGLIYNILVIALARLGRYRLFMHHHSYAYINAPSRLMALLTAIAGPKATHITLCSDMGRALAEGYPGVRQVMVLSNAAVMESPVVQPAAPRQGEMTLGFLSNLIIEKGVDTAIDITRQARERGHDVRLILAGGSPDAEVVRLVRAAEAELGSAIEVLGNLGDDDKAAFFGRLDLFILPTRYVNEAEPRVVIEALYHAVPVMVPARGCLNELVAGGAGVVVPPGNDYTKAALELIAAWCDDSPARDVAHAAAAARGASLAMTGREQMDLLLGRITGRY